MYNQQRSYVLVMWHDLSTNCTLASCLSVLDVSLVILHPWGFMYDANFKHILLDGYITLGKMRASPRHLFDVSINNGGLKLNENLGEQIVVDSKREREREIDTLQLYMQYTHCNVDQYPLCDRCCRLTAVDSLEGSSSLQNEGL